MEQGQLRTKLMLDRGEETRRKGELKALKRELLMVEKRRDGIWSDIMSGGDGGGSGGGQAKKAAAAALKKHQKRRLEAMGVGDRFPANARTEASLLRFKMWTEKLHERHNAAVGIPCSCCTTEFVVLVRFAD